MGSKLYVGNVSFRATEDEVRELFQPFGEIEDFFWAMDKMTGRPRGFAFVTYTTKEAADEALRSLDGTEFAGRPLRINEARERTEFAPRGGGYGGGGGGGGGGRGGYGGGGGGGGGRGDYGGGGRGDYGGGYGGDRDRGDRGGRGGRGGREDRGGRGGGYDYGDDGGRGGRGGRY